MYDINLQFFVYVSWFCKHEAEIPVCFADLDL